MSELEEDFDDSFEDIAFQRDDSEDNVINEDKNSAQDPLDLITKTIECMSPIHHDPYQENIAQEKPPSTFCAHPIHLHSLTRLTNLSSILRSRFNTCTVCSERISLISGEVVTCISCSIFIHRRCSQHYTKVPICTVNENILHKRERCCNEGTINENENEVNDVHNSLEQSLDAKIELDAESETRVVGYDDEKKSGSNSGSQSTTGSKATSEEMNTNAMETSQSSESSSEGLWSESGPPTHWALSKRGGDALKGLKGSSPKRPQTENIEENQNMDWKANFLDLSKVLHFDIFSRDSPEKAVEEHVEKPPGENNIQEVEEIVLRSASAESGEQNEDEIKTNSKIIVQRMSESFKNEENEKLPENLSKKEMIPVLEEAKPEPPTPTRTTQAIKGTVDAVKKTHKTTKSIGAASIVGGIAGATAGLIVGGPAGMFVGSRIGQAVGVAGVIIEGTISVGIIVAGVRGGIMTAQQIQNENKRMVKIGGKGSEQVVLVRPNVFVDPIWDEITMNIRQSAPRDNVIDGLALFGEKVANKKERRRRDRDIVNSEEDEINTKDKIFLLVANSLNDKRSLPGFVYRELVLEARKRAEERNILEIKDNFTEGNERDNMHSRASRQDVHAIIKHITATLVEVRPGFASSPTITELSALAVETIVFGEFYGDVMEEIKNETYENDDCLQKKLSNIENEAKKFGVNIDEHISEEAINSIRTLPSFHSVQDKLRCCVEILEFVSDAGSHANMGADFLLTLVCRHLVIAHIRRDPNLISLDYNAECAFLEEFAKDEQLLQGKEGYALVTLQASIHFLNACTDTLKDVFMTDD